MEILFWVLVVALAIVVYDTAKERARKRHERETWFGGWKDN